MDTMEKNYEDVGKTEEKQILIQPSAAQDTIIQQTRSQFHPQTPTQHGSNISSSTTDEHIRFGSCIALQHNVTSRYLSSESPDSNESSAKENKDQVFGTRRKSENELWMVLKAYGERHRLKTGDAIPYNTQIRLRHVESRRNLRSHPDYVSQISNQQEGKRYIFA